MNEPKNSITITIIRQIFCFNLPVALIGLYELSKMLRIPWVFRDVLNPPSVHSTPNQHKLDWMPTRKSKFVHVSLDNLALKFWWENNQTEVVCVH